MSVGAERILARSGATWLVVGLVLASAAWPAHAINGNGFALTSTGALGSGTDWVLNENGYLGTYLTLASPGSVTVSVMAEGQSGGGASPRMNIVLGDQRAGFDVVAGFNPYQHAFELPAGTHFLRTEYANDFVSNAVPAASRQLTVRTVDVAGAMIDNNNTDANALAAADTYIQIGRRGPARLQLHGAAPGTQVQVSLKRHAFNWGANVYGTGSTNPPPLSLPQFTQFFKDHFNMVVPSRAGKWNNNEPTRDQQIIYAVPGVPTSGYLDSILDFAEANDMRARMHNLIWGNDQTNEEQTAWAVSLLTNGSAASLNDLRGEISERIDYYVGGAPISGVDLADRYTELDVYNESVHTGVNTPGSSVNYWDRYGAGGIASIYQEAADAAAATGSTAKMYVNEYNVLQNGFDDYGNWYRQHIETINNFDGAPNGPVSGIGMQLYPLGSTAVGDGLSAAYMQQVLQTMSVSGLPQSITEFGVQNTVTNPDDAKQYVNHALRMAFGAPDMTTFMYWGFWANATSNLQSASTLANVDWSLTDIGKMYEDMLGIQDWDGNPDNGWTTKETLAVGPDGAIDFTGFFGDYEVKIGDVTYALNLAKGVEDYALIVGPPSADFDRDDDADGDDFLAWQAGFGTPADATLALGDADYDGAVDAADFDLWKAAFGVSALAVQEAVPEPSGAGLTMVALAVAGAVTRRRRERG